MQCTYARHCHLWPVWFYNIFPHYLMKGTIFKKGKKLIEHKMFVLIFCITFVRKNSHSKKNWARHDQSCILDFLWSTSYSCQILIKLEFSVQISEKYSGINFMKLRPVVAEFRADGQTDMTKLIVAFPNFAKVPKTQFLPRIKHTSTF
jgi:hypothetical protein